MWSSDSKVHEKFCAARYQHFFFCTSFLFTCATDFAEKEGLDLLIYLFFEVISLSQIDWLPQIVMQYFEDGSFAVIDELNIVHYG